jgi:hypothetical protein
LAGKESILGDRTGENGHMGRYFGFDLYVSNGGYWTGKLNMATNPTDGDTVTINGVLFTWKTTLGSTAGNIHICSDAAHSVTSFVASLNTPGTTVTSATDAGFVKLSVADQAKLYGLTATDATTNLTFTYRGAGAPVVSETLTAPADIWTSGLNISHNMFGAKGAVDFVIQKQPTVQIEKAEARLGYKVIPYTLFGKKTFADGAKKLIDVKVDTTLYT